MYGDFKMEKRKWRKRAKILGCVEVGRVTTWCVLVTAMIVGSFAWGPIGLMEFVVLAQNGHPGVMEKTYDIPKSVEGHHRTNPLQPDLKHLVWLMLGIGATLCLVEVVLTWKLLKACRLDCKQSTALKNVRFWRNIRLMFLMVSCAATYDMSKTGFTESIQLAGLTIAWYIFGLSVVQMYIYELEAERDALAEPEKDKIVDSEVVNTDADV